MSALDRVPANTGFLQETKFTLQIPNLKTSLYFLQAANLPGLSIESPSQATPLINIPRAGTKLEHEPFDMTFIVDENLESWKEIYFWIEGFARPPTFPIKPHKDSFFDGILTFQTNLNNPNMRVKFYKMFPISLSGIEMTTTGSAENTLTAKASFLYDYYEFESA